MKLRVDWMAMTHLTAHCSHSQHLSRLRMEILSDQSLAVKRWQTIPRAWSITNRIKRIRVRMVLTKLTAFEPHKCLRWSINPLHYLNSGGTRAIRTVGSVFRVQLKWRQPNLNRTIASLTSLTRSAAFGNFSKARCCFTIFALIADAELGGAPRKFPLQSSAAAYNCPSLPSS